MEPRIEISTGKILVGIRTRMTLAGNTTARLWQSFMPRRNEIKNKTGSDLFSVEIYDETTDINSFNAGTGFEKWAAVEVSSPDEIPAGLETFVLPGGLYAVFTYRGAANDFADTFRYIFGTWLPASIYMLDARPHFEIMGEKYKGNEPDSEEDIWIPISLKQQGPEADKSRAAAEVFNKQANTYQDKFMNVDLYHDSLDLFCDHIVKGADILELACGPGNVTKYLLQKRPDLNILGTDLAPDMIALAQANNPQAKFQLMDCRDIGVLTGKYDAILCSFGLPYLSKEDAIRLIVDAAKLLRPGGVLYLSTMADDYSRSGYQTSGSGDTIFVHYHEADYLRARMEDNGFELIDMRHQDFPAGPTKTTDLIIVAKKSA